MSRLRSDSGAPEGLGLDIGREAMGYNGIGLERKEENLHPAYRPQFF